LQLEPSNPENVAEAARRSEIDRAHLFRLLKKYGLKRGR
jgi:transcriptional regulator of acetoin/glycerol metabolism